MLEELPEPQGGFITRWARLDNGVYFVDTTDGPTIAVHAEIADEELSDTARELGTPRGGYLYYHWPAQAIPMYELSRENHNVYALTDRKWAAETLRRYFPGYWAAQNDNDAEDEWERGDDD